MSTVITARDIEELIQSGRSVSSIPGDAIITPSARDLIRDFENKAASTGANGGNGGPAVAKAPNGDVAYVAGQHIAPPPVKLNSKSPKQELESFFNSPYAH